MIEGHVQLHGIHFCNLVLNLSQNLLLPNRRHNEVIDKYFELVLRNALFQNELVVLHDRIDMQLHIQLLQSFILFEPKRIRVVFYVELDYLTNQLLYLLLVQNIPYCIHLHFKLI